MRSFSTLVKLTGCLLIVAVLALSSLNRQSVLAGGAAQSTEAAATMVATTAAGSASAMTYPPCPAPVATAADTSATDSAAPVAAATDTTMVQAATMAATANPTPAYLGVKAEQVEECGSRIVEVVAGGPASKSTLQSDDVVVALNDTAVPSVATLRREIESRQPGDKVKLTVQRKGDQVDVEVTLGPKPVDTTSAVAGTTTIAAETEVATAPAAATMAATK